MSTKKHTPRVEQRSTTSIHHAYTPTAFLACPSKRTSHPCLSSKQTCSLRLSHPLLHPSTSKAKANPSSFNVMCPCAMPRRSVSPWCNERQPSIGSSLGTVLRGIVRKRGEGGKKYKYRRDDGVLLVMRETFRSVFSEEGRGQAGLVIRRVLGPTDTFFFSPGEELGRSR